MTTPIIIACIVVITAIVVAVMIGEANYKPTSDLFIETPKTQPLIVYPYPPDEAMIRTRADIRALMSVLSSVKPQEPMWWYEQYFEEATKEYTRLKEKADKGDA